MSHAQKRFAEAIKTMRDVLSSLWAQ